MSTCAPPTRVLLMSDVKRLTGKGRTTIWRWVKEDIFPQPIKISAQRIGWYEEVVEAWLAKHPYRRRAALQASVAVDQGENFACLAEYILGESEFHGDEDPAVVFALEKLAIRLRRMVPRAAGDKMMLRVNDAIEDTQSAKEAAYALGE